MIIAKSSGTSVPRELTPAGTHIARCYSMVHIGTVQWEYLGEIKNTDKVRLTFELPYETKVFNEEKGEQPLVISKEYTLSLHEKANLRQDLENWRGKSFTEKEAKEFDISKLIGAPCSLSVIHKEAKNGNTYANIGAITALPKGSVCPVQVNDGFEFNFDDKFDIDFINDSPDFLKDAIKSTPEYEKCLSALHHGHLDEQVVTEVEDESDDLPF